LSTIALEMFDPVPTHEINIIKLKSNPSNIKSIITFTCNPECYEIVSAFNPGESYTDRPDLCVGVIKMKVNSVLQDVTTKLETTSLEQ
jgi:hypothetical protein